MFKKWSIRLAVGSLACLAGGPALAHLGLLPSMAGLAALVFSGLLGLAAMAAGAAAALRDRAYFHAMVGMLGCIPFVAVAAALGGGLSHPLINDISTDVADPPAFVEALALPENAGRDLTFPDDFGPVIQEHYPDLAPLHITRPPEQVYRHARGLADAPAFRWTVTGGTIETLRVEAVAETRLFRWKDDVVVRIRPDGAGGSIVDMRSKSREGKGDLGANARRIRRFFEALRD